ncbi:MAG TPA: MarR family winged helix-turn-helix transcriptional regulator [Mycobacteriales bacterium]|nr:MarR family winged helix-turn-helix transcriptional regulator [Mycobacteriales bacterium]
MSRSAAGDALTELVITVFQVNGRLLQVADELAAAGGLTAARWQVLGAVLDEARPVADIARRMGLTRQSVQRLANVLVDEGFATWEPNPQHARAKLLRPTAKTARAMQKIGAVQRPWADTVGGAIGARELTSVRATLRELLAALDDVSAARDSAGPIASARRRPPGGSPRRPGRR